MYRDCEAPGSRLFHSDTRPVIKFTKRGLTALAYKNQ
jgi:hypothetical protein